jgi:hypothetical protein
MSEPAKFRRSDDVSFQTLGPQVVIINARSREVHVLNGPATRIWELLERETSISEIANTLREEYEIGDADAESEVATFIRNLGGKGLTAPRS